MLQVETESLNRHRRTIDALAEYSVRFHAALGDGHAVASPLGAWLLMAAVAPLAEGGVKADLERVLGCPTGEAAAFLAALLEARHPAVSAALAVWIHPERTKGVLDAWAAALPHGVEGGGIPTQPEANTWAREKTRGMVERFPLTISPLSACLLASALATAGEWEREFGITRGPEGMRPSCWDPGIEYFLDTHVRGEEAIVWTESAGLVGTLARDTKEALTVVSVVAAPEVPAPRVFAAVHEVAALLTGRESTASPRSLYDLPLGAGHAWTIVESEFETDLPNQRLQWGRVTIPSWKADSPEVDLMKDPAFGLVSAASAVIDRLPPIPEGYAAQAAQTTRAQFDRYGFSAASVTALDIMCGAASGGWQKPKLKGISRTAHVQFCRPYAVVAVTQGPGDPGHGSVPWRHAWHGVPVFGAWVKEAIETDRMRRR